MNEIRFSTLSVRGYRYGAGALIGASWQRRGSKGHHASFAVSRDGHAALATFSPRTGTKIRWYR